MPLNAATQLVEEAPPRPAAPGAKLAVLVVDDEASMRNLLSVLLRSEGFDVLVASTLEHARAHLAGATVDLVLADKNLPDGSGLSLAREVFAAGDDREVVIMSAYASVNSAVEAMQLAVADFIVKPFESLDEVLARVRRVADHQALKRRNRALLEELQAKNRELEQLACRDALTGLYNHAFFQATLEREIARANRSHHEFSVVFIDVDHFKQVNDTLGHPTGDVVLRGVADLLHHATRKSDVSFRLGEQDIAARYGGDEFVLLLPETPKSGAAVLAESLRCSVERLRLCEGVIPPTLSIGVATFPDDAADRGELIRAADAALYAAKALGRNRTQVYGPNVASLRGLPADGSGAREILALERLLDLGAFRFVYQPIVDARTGRAVGYEGLCRTDDGTFTSFPEVIQAAERSRKVWELGRQLRRIVIEPIVRLPEGCSLFINIHPYELDDPQLRETEELLRPYAKNIVFEVIETSALQNFERARTVLQRLQAQGFRIALDDLGSGYSGLNTLANLAPDFVKLDIGLLRGIERDSRSARLIKHILEFAVDDGIQVVAEGIETEEERHVVTQLGCPLLQGYYFARPGEPFPPVNAH